jgi:uncharacterized damage-inducible protein DinB
MSDLIKEHFTRLYEHVEWANALVLGSLRSAKNLRTKDLELYAHIIGAEHVWLSRLNGTTPRLAVWPTLSLEECETLSKDNISAFSVVVSRLTPEMLRNAITYRNSAGDQFTSTIEDILTHVALHGAYHRGQIAASLRTGGDAPNSTDYIAFTRGAPTATRHG